MNNKITLDAVLIQVDSGNDFFDRYLRPKDVITYTFECEKKRFVWQVSESNYFELLEGNRYKIRALEGRKLFGGRGISLIDVEIIEEV